MLIVLVAFSQFGLWQLRRHAEVAERNAVLVERLAQAPVELDAALAAAAVQEAQGADADEAVRFRRVAVAGTFEPDDEVLRRPVSRDGAPGYHVVTPLRLAGDPDGRRLWVERGWVPQAFDEVPVPEAPPPPGEVEVVGWLRGTTGPPSGWVAALAPRDPPSGRLVTVAYLDPERLADQVAGPLVPAVLWLESLVPDPGARWPRPPETPAVDPGPHLAYAIQWFAFALVTIVGYSALLRRARSSDASSAS